MDVTKSPTAYISTSPFGSRFVDAGSACPIVWRPKTRARPRLCSAPAKHSDALAVSSSTRIATGPANGVTRRPSSVDEARVRRELRLAPPASACVPSSERLGRSRGRETRDHVPPARRDCRADRSRVPPLDGTCRRPRRSDPSTVAIQTLKPMKPTRRPVGDVTSRASTVTWSGGRLPSFTIWPVSIVRVTLTLRSTPPACARGATRAIRRRRESRDTLSDTDRGCAHARRCPRRRSPTPRRADRPRTESRRRRAAPPGRAVEPGTTRVITSPAGATRISTGTSASPGSVSAADSEESSTKCDWCSRAEHVADDLANGLRRIRGLHLWAQFGA